MTDKEYGIIREQGEYMVPVMLSEEDNQKVNRQDDENKDKE